MTAMDQARLAMMGVRIPPPGRALKDRLVIGVLEAIERRRGPEYGSLQISDEQAIELARGIASNVLADFDVRDLSDNPRKEK